MSATATSSRRGAALAGALLVGAVVALALGVYGREHEPKPHPLFDAGFSSYVQFKVWFTTAAAVLVRV